MLGKLKFLDVSSNQITALPGSIGQLVGLDFFGAASNRLRFLPASIANLTSYKERYVNNNLLGDLPSKVQAWIGLPDKRGEYYPTWLRRHSW